MQLAGELADGAIIGAFASPQTLRYATQHLLTGAARGGRDLEGFEIMSWLHTALSSNLKEAAAAVRQIVAEVLVSSLPILDRFELALSADLKSEVGLAAREQAPDAIEGIASRVPDELLTHFTMVGDAASCVERVTALERFRVTQVAVMPWLIPGQTFEDFMSAFANGVIDTYRSQRRA